VSRRMEVITESETWFWISVKFHTGAWGRLASV
jgi:hypothetical protein